MRFLRISVISLRKSVDDLTRLEELEKREGLSEVIRECFARTIYNSARYAVEVDEGLAMELRHNLQALEERSRAVTSPDQLRSVQASFRGEIRQYRDKSNAQLQKLRKDVENAGAAMTIFAETVASNGDNHEMEVRGRLQKLELIGRSQTLSEIRDGIDTAVSGIQASVEHIQRGNQLVIAQLQDEIRVLHLEMDQERKVLFTDRASGAWNRQKVDIHLANLLRQNQPMCVLLVSVRNLMRLNNRYSCTVVEGALKALVSRFAVLAGDDAVVARWSEEQFIAVMDLAPGQATSLAAEVDRKLSGGYAVQENGLSQTLIVQITAGVLERSPGSEVETFHQKLRQLAVAISGG